MKCTECGWHTLNTALKTDRVCCNQESEKYNQIMTEDEFKTKSCDNGESQEAIDYHNMSPWGFASKYYG